MQVSTTDELRMLVTGLTEDRKYVVRVAAKNAVGVGEFTEIRDVIPKCQFGKETLTCYFNQLLSYNCILTDYKLSADFVVFAANAIFVSICY